MWRQHRLGGAWSRTRALALLRQLQCLFEYSRRELVLAPLENLFQARLSTGHNGGIGQDVLLSFQIRLLV